MLDNLLHYFRLRRLQSRRRHVQKLNDKRVRAVRAVPPHVSTIEPEVHVQAAEYEAWCDDREFEGEILQLQTRHLIRLLEVYDLPYPEQSDWVAPEDNAPFYHRHLTRVALARLRSAIRQERKERWEGWTRWTPLLSALTGLLGVTVAVIALFLKT